MGRRAGLFWILEMCSCTYSIGKSAIFTILSGFGRMAITSSNIREARNLKRAFKCEIKRENIDKV